ncbi:MAG: hypothetical protein AAFX93_11400 [Verrucomicrobiota bacterium]
MHFPGTFQLPGTISPPFNSGVLSFFFRKLKKVVGDFFADISHFFRHGLKRRFRHVGGYFRYFGKQVGEWQGSSEARKKVAQREREEKRAMSQMQNARKKEQVGSWFVSLLLSPITLTKATFRKLNELRRMSIRDAIADLWFSYRGMIAKALNTVEWSFFVWLKLPLFVRILSVIAVVGGVGVIGTAPWWVRAVKAERSEAILAEAKELKEQDQLVKAYGKARTAALLRPDDREALELVVELAEENRNPELIWWNERLAKIHGFDAQSLTNIIENAADYGQIKVGYDYLSMLKDRYPEHEFVVDAEIRLMLAQGRLVNAFQLAKRHAKEGKDTVTIHGILAEQLWFDRTNGAQDRLIDYIDEHLYRDDEVGIEISRFVIAYPGRLVDDERFDFNKFLRHIAEHPEAKPDDKAYAYFRAFEFDAINRQELIDGVMAIYDWEDAEEREAGIRSFLIFEIYEVADQIVTDKLLASDNSVSTLHLQRLILGDEPDLVEAARLLDLPPESRDFQISPINRSTYRVLLAKKQRDTAAFREYLQQTLEFAETNDWVEIEALMVRSLDEASLLEFYKESFRRMSNNPLVVSRYLEYLYSNGLEKELQASLPQISLDTFLNAAYHQVFVVYLKALYEDDLASCRYYAENLIAEYPKNSNMYSVLAFVYRQSGREELGQRLLATMAFDPEVKNNIAPYFLLSYALSSETPELLEGVEFRLGKERDLIRKATEQTAAGSL